MTRRCFVRAALAVSCPLLGSLVGCAYSGNGLWYYQDRLERKKQQREIEDAGRKGETIAMPSPPALP
jgi:hypothetical protein